MKEDLDSLLLYRMDKRTIKAVLRIALVISVLFIFILPGNTVFVASVKLSAKTKRITAGQKTTVSLHQEQFREMECNCLMGIQTKTRF